MWNHPGVSAVEVGMTPGLCSALATVAVGAVACTGAHPRPEQVKPAPTGISSPAPTTFAFALYTHCGIREARVAGHYYKTVPPLDDGSGNPPAGWDSPVQYGAMTKVSTEELIFTDATGHRVRFWLRPGARGFEHLCS